MLQVVRPADVDTQSVTSEQIGRCYKILHRDGNFYLVQSESDDLKEYKVSFDTKLGMRCTCPAADYGFIRCRLGYCKHILWALAAEREERQALAELAMKQATYAYLSELVAQAIRDEDQHQADLAKKPAKQHRSRWDKRYEQRKPFSLLK